MSCHLSMSTLRPPLVTRKTTRLKTFSLCLPTSLNVIKYYKYYTHSEGTSLKTGASLMCGDN